MFTGTVMLGVFHALANMQKGLNRGSRTGPSASANRGKTTCGVGLPLRFQYGTASSGVMRMSMPSGGWEALIAAAAAV